MYTFTWKVIATIEEDKFDIESDEFSNALNSVPLTLVTIAKGLTEEDDFKKHGITVSVEAGKPTHNNG